MARAQTITTEKEALVPVPDHIPVELVVDFDMYNPPGIERDFHLAWVDLRDRCKSDLVWTPRNGGHWIPLKGVIIQKMLADYESFASRIFVLPPSQGAEQRVLPTTINPPEHGPYRALLNRPLSTKSVMAVEPEIRKLATEAIDPDPGDVCELAFRSLDEIKDDIVRAPDGVAYWLRHYVSEHEAEQRAMTIAAAVGAGR